MALQFAPSGKMLLAQTDEGIDIFDAGNLKIVHSIPIASQNFTISGDGHILALASKQRPSLVHIINLDSGEEMASWVVPVASESVPSHIAFHSWSSNADGLAGIATGYIISG